MGKLSNIESGKELEFMEEVSLSKSIWEKIRNLSRGKLLMICATLLSKQEKYLREEQVLKDLETMLKPFE